MCALATRANGKSGIISFLSRCKAVPRQRAWVVLTLLLLAPAVALAAPAAPSDHRECVVLLHGLARSSSSMTNMQDALVAVGYYVVNIDYASREHSVAQLANDVVAQGFTDCAAVFATRVHFVTHSLGGILVRHYLAQHKPTTLGRVVMLGPPNQGSEVVDTLRDVPGFEWINGPAGQQLGTDNTSIPTTLPPVDFECGVIAGDRTINLFLSLLIPGSDDGKVSIERAKVTGMTDFLVVHRTHPFIMQADEVITQTLQFLRRGRFDHTPR